MAESKVQKNLAADVATLNSQYKIKKVSFNDVSFDETDSEGFVTYNSTNFPNMEVGPISAMTTGGWPVVPSGVHDGKVFIRIIGKPPVLTRPVDILYI